jgi:MFS family permease
MLAHFHLLRNRNYAIYFSGQMFSMVGTWMQAVVQSWLVYRLSQSSAWLGAVSFATQAPAFLAAPIAGVMSDRRERRKVLVTAYAWAMVQAFALAALVLTDAVELWHVLALSVLLGVTNAFDMTVRHTFAVDIVGKRELPSAIALNNLLFHGARVLGPAAAGLLIALIGEGGCFLLNGVSYLAVILGLLVIRLERRPALSGDDGGASVLQQLRETVRYVRGQRAIMRLLLTATFISFAGMAYTALLPVVAKEILGGGASTLGWLTASNAAGSILGAMAASRLNATSSGPLSPRRLRFQIVGMGLAVLVLGLVTEAWAANLALFFSGFFAMRVYPVINNAIQQTVADGIRGRVMSLYAMSFLGAMPVGNLVAGAIAEYTGVPPVLIGSGAVCAAFGLALALAPVRAQNVNPSMAPKAS